MIDFPNFVPREASGVFDRLLKIGFGLAARHNIKPVTVAAVFGDAAPRVFENCLAQAIGVHISRPSRLPGNRSFCASASVASCWIAIAFRQRFDEWANLTKKLLASVNLLTDVLLVELCELNIVAFLPVPEEPVVQIAMFPSEPTGLDEVLVEGRAHAAMLPESTPLFQKQGAHRVKERIISAVDGERKRFSSQVSAGGV